MGKKGGGWAGLFIIWFLKILFKLNVFIYLLLSGYIICYHMCRGQKTTCKSLFFPSAMQVWGIKVRPSGLATSSLISWTIMVAGNVNYLIWSMLPVGHTSSYLSEPSGWAKLFQRVCKSIQNCFHYSVCVCDVYGWYVCVCCIVCVHVVCGMCVLSVCVLSYVVCVHGVCGICVWYVYGVCVCVCVCCIVCVHVVCGICVWYVCVCCLMWYVCMVCVVYVCDMCMVCVCVCVCVCVVETSVVFHLMFWNWLIPDPGACCWHETDRPEDPWDLPVSAPALTLCVQCHGVLTHTNPGKTGLGLVLYSLNYLPSSYVCL